MILHFALKQKVLHCVKSFCIWSFRGSYFQANSSAMQVILLPFSSLLDRATFKTTSLLDTSTISTTTFLGKSKE